MVVQRLMGIETSLNEHMRRTDILEVETKSNRRYVFMALGAVGTIPVFGAVLAALRTLQSLLN